MDYTQGPPPPPPPSPAPPFPAPPPPPKKGLHPLAWAGIGCGGLVVVIGVISALTAVMVGKKAIASFKEHPAKDAVAELVKRLPAYQKVAEDFEKGSIVLRSKTDGAIVTTGYDPFILGTTEVKDAAGSPRPIATGDLTKIPAWVPRYSPAGTEACLVQRDDVAETSGVFAFTTTDRLDDVMAFYGKEAERLSMHSSATSATDFNGRVSRSLRVSGGKRMLRVHAHAVGGPPWIVQVVYEEKK